MQQIYKITNILNGKAYIGQHNGSQSWYFGSGSALKRALKKYGKSNFKKEIICKGHFDKELLDLLEVEAIEKHQTFAGDYPMNGYNLNKGGQGSKSSVIKNKPSSQFIKRKTVYKYSINGDYLGKYNSIADAAKSCLVSYVAISNCLRGKGFISGGFQWRFNYYKSVDKYVSHRAENQVRNRQIPVEMLTLNGDYIRSFDSAKQASIFTGVTVSGIRACCYGKYNYYKGYRWRFAIKTALDNPNNENY